MYTYSVYNTYIYIYIHTHTHIHLYTYTHISEDPEPGGRAPRVHPATAGVLQDALGHPLLYYNPMSHDVVYHTITFNMLYYNLI